MSDQSSEQNLDTCLVVINPHLIFPQGEKLDAFAEGGSFSYLDKTIQKIATLVSTAHSKGMPVFWISQKTGLVKDFTAAVGRAPEMNPLVVQGGDYRLAESTGNAELFFERGTKYFSELKKKGAKKLIICGLGVSDDNAMKLIGNCAEDFTLLIPMDLIPSRRTQNFPIEVFEDLAQSEDKVVITNSEKVLAAIAQHQTPERVMSAHQISMAVHTL